MQKCVKISSCCNLFMQFFPFFQRSKTDSSKSSSKSQSLSELPDLNKKCNISGPLCVQRVYVVDTDKKLKNGKVCMLIQTYSSVSSSICFCNINKVIMLDLVLLVIIYVIFLQFLTKLMRHLARLSLLQAFR